MLKFLQTPTNLLAWSQKWQKPTLAVGFSLISAGIWLALIWSPVDSVQGETVRIMYIHVPASWGAMMTYFAMAITSGYAFIKQNPMAHWITRAMAPVGLVLCLMSLITGAIWGKPTWGGWWVWDARLTSMLILCLLYASYIVTAHIIKPEQQALKISAILAIIGSINLPIIKWSVTWWHTLHQPASILRLSKPAIHWMMMLPLFVMAFGLAFICFYLFLQILQNELHHRKLVAQLLRKSE